MLKSGGLEIFYIFKRVFTRRAMGVSNVNNQNQINLVKLALARGGTKTATSNKPAYMQMTGSIFNAPGNKTKNSISIIDMNTKRALANLSSGTTNKTQNSNGGNSTVEVKNASQGRQMAASAEADADSVKELTSQTQNDARTAQTYSDQAISMSKNTEKSEQSFYKQLQRQQDELKEDNKKCS